MKCGIKHCNLGDIVAHDLFAGGNSGDVRGIVERSKWSAVFNSLEYLVCDKDGGREKLSAVDNAVTYCVDFGH